MGVLGIMETELDRQTSVFLETPNTTTRYSCPSAQMFHLHVSDRTLLHVASPLSRVRGRNVNNCDYC